MRDQIRRRSVGAPAARSILLTILGEYVLKRGGAVWQETLVEALGRMGYTEQASRQAISRSARDGWLDVERHGRRTRIVLREHMIKMIADSAERIYSFGEPWEWDGRWLMVIMSVPEHRRDVRHQLRSSLAWAGLGSLGAGMYLTPHLDREAELAAAFAAEPAVDALSFVAANGQIGDPSKIIHSAWPLDEVTAAYRTFIEDFARAKAATPETCFRAQTMLVHAWSRFPYLDPDLPRELLPRGWPHDRAYEIFQRHHERWATSAQELFSAVEASYEAEREAVPT